MSVDIKLVLRTCNPREIRRAKVNDFNDFLEKVKRYSGIEDVSGHTLQYRDDDQDWITFSSSEEFEEMKLIKKSPVRVRVMPEKVQNAQPRWEGRRNRRFERRQQRRNLRQQRRNNRRQRRFGMCPQAQNCHQNAVPQQINFPNQWANGAGQNDQRSIKQMRRMKRQYLRRAGVCHKNITCDSCGKNNWPGKRLKCKNCPNYDLCGKCYRTKRSVHDLSHQFEVVHLPGKKQHMKRFKQQFMKPMGAYHKNIICDGCEKKEWVGRRLKCKICPNFDLCGHCHNKKRNQVHDPSHEFEEIPLPVFPKRQQQQPEQQKEEEESEGEEDMPRIITEAELNEQEPVLEEEPNPSFLPPVSEKPTEEDEPKEESLMYPEIYEDVEVKEPEEDKLKRKWGMQLKLLREMGFVDDVINTYLLEQQNGNTQRVIELLVQMN